MIPHQQIFCLRSMDVCRLNFSHGEHAVHKEIFDRIRNLSAEWNNQVGILCDIQGTAVLGLNLFLPSLVYSSDSVCFVIPSFLTRTGPKIRTGKMEAPFDINVGDKIRVTPEPILGNKERISISYEEMLKDLNKDDVIFINDGIVKLVVVDKDDKDLICECHAAGKISNHKGCNMPSGKLSVNVVTPKDAKDLKFIAELNPEYVAASFVGTGEDVKKVRDCLKENGNSDIKIIAKVERPVALENLDAIIEEADAVMVARGDLGEYLFDGARLLSFRPSVTNSCILARRGNRGVGCSQVAKGNG
jgi:pyruvate kinase